MKKQNECLNFFKGIACILVVSLHVRFPVEAVDGVIQCIARFAVPLFFMISGYYCCFEDDGIYLILDCNAVCSMFFGSGRT